MDSFRIKEIIGLSLFSLVFFCSGHVCRAANLEVIEIRNGQAPLGMVEIQGVGARTFDPALWQKNQLHWIPDLRMPLLAPRMGGAFRNIYAPSAVEEGTGWLFFYSAWDGTESGNDRIYMARTPDFIDFYDRHTIIHNGQFVHVSNVNVQRLDPDSLELYATAWPDPQRQNKPIHFSSKLNGLEGPLQGMKISSRMNRRMGRTSEDRRSLWRVSIPFCERGDKTDFRDAENLAHLHRHGLLKGSYLPNRRVVELRDFTRRRKKLLGNLTPEKNRIQKVLEVANVKIGNVVSDVFGVSGQAMVEALLSGQEIPAEQIAELSKRRLRHRIPELTEALRDHHLNDHHRFLIAQSAEHAVLLDRQMEELEALIQKKLEPYPQQYELLQTIPGVKEMTAASILAEIGPDMN